jgi:type II secretory pathway pseudopilin PulG
MAGPGFSLVEVVLAMGVFGSAVLSVFLLLSASARESSRSDEYEVASRVSQEIERQLKALRLAHGWESPTAWLEWVAAHSGRARWVATRDGRELRLLDADAAGEDDGGAPSDFYLFTLHMIEPEWHPARGRLLGTIEVAWPLISSSDDGGAAQSRTRMYSRFLLRP